MLHKIGALSGVLDACVLFVATMTLTPVFEHGAVLDAIELDRVTVFDEFERRLGIVVLERAGAPGRKRR